MLDLSVLIDSSDPTNHCPVQGVQKLWAKYWLGQGREVSSTAGVLGSIDVVGPFGEGEGRGLQEQDCTPVSMSSPYSHFITIAPDRDMALVDCRRPFLASTESF